ncbi:hypothetical protein BC938DRAFT_478364 [Jimgerdemannia flammicorona]|uniref:Uncharacterized protein n=1 Tax=Jimgerdemannia flammicorona TaxID=994334 RepID=A0A433QYC8_9FUNG|nr:hypothetical protein BC938DRAFT_478364 [Jimgerdemannia flammicorona]
MTSKRVEKPLYREHQKQRDIMESIWEDLENWQFEIKQRDSQLLKKTPVPAQKIISPRATTEIVLGEYATPKSTIVKRLKPDNAATPRTSETSQNTTATAKSAAKGTERITSNDYRSWDKFDADKAVQDLDDLPEKSKFSTKSSISGGPPVVTKGTPKKTAATSAASAQPQQSKAKLATPAEMKHKGNGNPRTEQALAEKDKSLQKLKCWIDTGTL